MQSKHVVVWLDHTEAHIIHFNRDDAEANHLKSAGKQHLHVKASGSGGSGRAAEDRNYLDGVVDAVKDAEAILIVGPGFEKLALVKHMLKHHHLTAEKVVAVESSDHPSDGQLLAHARKYFVGSDRMRLAI
jgi:stalled ribosome rescue protein Dom34